MWASLLEPEAQHSTHFVWVRIWVKVDASSALPDWTAANKAAELERWSMPAGNVSPYDRAAGKCREKNGMWHSST